MSVEFSIKDLENICGVKAHTIRMWEKRYNILAPNRTVTNIRTYDAHSLKKLLSVSFLVNCGYKISRVAKLSDEEINEYLRIVISDKTLIDHSSNLLKLAMLNYSATTFNEAYSEMIERLSFNTVFDDIFIPFLKEIGTLWQLGTINNSHEHFITNLIKQKLYNRIEFLQQTESTRSRCFVLFLPEGEISNLSLLYLYQILLSKGYKTIFLGHGTHLEHLVEVSKLHTDMVFLTYITISLNTDTINTYIDNFREAIGFTYGHEIWLMGRITKQAPISIDSKTKVINNFKDFELLVN